MEDTKNMIERYKRELMELMKSSPSRTESMSKGDTSSFGAAKYPGDPNQDGTPLRNGDSNRDGMPKYVQPVPETDSSPMTPVQPSSQPPEAEGLPETEMEIPSQSEVTPRIIGYVEDDVRVPDEYGRLISEITDNDGNSEEDDALIDDMITENTNETVSQIEPETGVSQQRESAAGMNPTDEEMARGSRGTPTEYPEPKYESYEQFTERNIGRGTIIFRVYTAREALPIKGARCVLSKRIAGSEYEIASMLTNESGQTPPQTLPAPSKELSQQVENSVQPFALYDATVTKNGYTNVILRDIPVFDGVQSIQRVAMIPSDDNETETITEVPDANE